MIFPCSLLGFALFWPRLGIASEKASFFIPWKDYLLIGTKFKGKHNPKLMTNYKYRTMVTGVGVMRNNFIYEVTQDVMKYLIQGGIVQNFVKYIENVVFKPLQDDGEEMRAFALKDLEFGFVIYLAACGVSFGTFVAELLNFYTRKILGYRLILVNLMRMRHS